MTDIDKDINNKVVDGAAIKDIVLMHASFEAVEEHRSRLDEDELLVNSEAMVLDVRFTEDYLNSRVLCEFKVSVAPSSEPDLSAFCVVNRFYIFFSFTDNLEGETGSLEKGNFSVRSGVFGAYPYFRRFVSSCAEMSRVELPVLPLLKSKDINVESINSNDDDSSSMSE